jgi:hypothetical protein
MDYEAVFRNLSRNPPIGWRLIHFLNIQQGGIYIWPSHVPLLVEQPNLSPDARLLHFSILFEFHVIQKSNRARILARARFHVKPAENDLRWASWRDLATKHCGVEAVKEKGRPKTTKSIGLWDVGILDQPLKAANQIRSFLGNPPSSLTCFIGHLGHQH